jgi:hypothetical protein
MLSRHICSYVREVHRDVTVILFLTGFVFVGFLATAHRSNDFVMRCAMGVQSQDPRIGTSYDAKKTAFNS